MLITGKEGDLEHNIALSFCYQLRKGPQLAMLSLSGQTCDVCFTVLCFP